MFRTLSERVTRNRWVRQRFDNGVPIHLPPNSQFKYLKRTAAAFSWRPLASFLIAQRGRASNFLSAVGGNNSLDSERERVVVPTIALDDLLAIFGAPTFVKIDVEGAEIQVLEGAGRLLREVRSVFYLRQRQTPRKRVNASCSTLVIV